MDAGRSRFLIAEVFRGVFISSLAFLTVTLVPFLSTMMLILIPLPICFYYTKLGRIKGFLVFVLSLLIVGAVEYAIAAQTAITILFALGALGMVLSEIMKRGLTIGWTISLAAFAGIFLIGAILIYNSILYGKLPWDQIYVYVAGMVQENIKLYGQLDLPSEQMQYIKENSGKIARILTYTFPALSLISLSVIILVNLLICRTLSRISEPASPDFGDLSLWKASDYLVWVLIVSGAGLLIPLLWIKFTALNFLILCLFIYFLQGIAIIEFFFKRKKAPFYLRFIFYFLIMIQQYLMF
ncbi:MAG TPA: hypothetical protein DCG53_10220, partial [Syntrophus sp. (in: bacteria)]|nr:hypothetical protein [Syntrophus sp. (in: bacteria)]